MIAGTLFQTANEFNPNATVLSVDGVRACDHVLATMLCRLAWISKPRVFFPFVLYRARKLQRVIGTTTTDGEGKQRRLKDGNKVTFRCRCCFPSALGAFFKGVPRYLVVGERLRILGLGRGLVICIIWPQSLQRNVGIQFHQEKTRAWNISGTVPKKACSFGEVWRTDGIKVACGDFGQAHAGEEERRLWDAIRLFQISSPHGKFWFRAPIFEQTTPSEHCPFVCFKNTLVATMRACGTRPRGS